MCKKANRFYLVLLVWYVAASFGIGLFLRGIDLPLWGSLCLSQCFILLPGLLFLLIQKINPFKCFGFRVLKPLDVLLSILFGYTLIPLILLLNYVSMLFATNEMQSTSTELAYNYPIVVQFLLMAVMPACVEEFVFRGILFHMHRKNGVIGAAVVTGVAFGLFHLNFNQFMYAFVLGIILALLVEATSSLFSSMLAHFAVNTYSLILLNLIPQSFYEQAQQETQMVSVGAIGNIVIIVMFAMFAAAGLCISFVIYRTLAKRNNRWEYMKTSIQQGFVRRNGEHFLTAPYWVAVVCSVAFMVYAELQHFL